MRMMNSLSLSIHSCFCRMTCLCAIWEKIIILTTERLSFVYTLSDLSSLRAPDVEVYHRTSFNCAGSAPSPGVPLVQQAVFLRNAMFMYFTMIQG